MQPWNSTVSAQSRRATKAFAPNNPEWVQWAHWADGDRQVASTGDLVVIEPRNGRPREPSCERGSENEPPHTLSSTSSMKQGNLLVFLIERNSF